MQTFIFSRYFLFFDKKNFTLESSTINNDLLRLQKKKNIKLIPINPSVCFATTPSTSTDKNAPVFVPMIDISGRKYFPVYLKQSIDKFNRELSFND